MWFFSLYCVNVSVVYWFGNRFCADGRIVEETTQFWLFLQPDMSYSELESGYQGLRQNRRGFYVGHDDDDDDIDNDNDNLLYLVSNFVSFLFCFVSNIFLHSILTEIQSFLFMLFSVFAICQFIFVFHLFIPFRIFAWLSIECMVQSAGFDDKLNGSQRFINTGSP